ncbi:putative ubiquitin-conjugating enzyme E2 26 [Hordeum vulgare]|nr:putative ubiquitin-conjugating enzyme E2 26 [Hordeum vulgare]
MGLACQNLVDIQGEYKILGSKEKNKDSLVDLAIAIIDPYHRGMKDVWKKKKVAWHCTWIRRMDEDHIKWNIDGMQTKQIYHTLFSL